MKRWLQSEEAGLFLAGIYGLGRFDYSIAWWAWPFLFLLPDLGMLGYLAGPRTGAVTYNLLHHKGLAAVLLALGLALSIPYLSFSGLLLLTHACFDRVLGYGLKYASGFTHTHLGEIGKAAKAGSNPSPDNK